MKNGLNKFAKGMFAIFTIRLLFVGAFFIIQSCNQDSNDIEINSAEDDFLSSLQISKDNFSNVGVAVTVKGLFLKEVPVMMNLEK